MPRQARPREPSALDEQDDDGIDDSGKSTVAQPRKRFKHGKPRFQESAPGLMKKKIRDLERLLQRMTDMPADLRIRKERELQAARFDLKQANAAAKRSKMAKQYQMVRFYESQKAKRRLKRAKKALESCDDASQQTDLRRDLHIAEVDLNYTLYYPITRPYCSLYPSKQGDEDSEKLSNHKVTDRVTRGDTEIWKRVEEATSHGQTALEALRDKPPSNHKKVQPAEGATPYGKQGPTAPRVGDSPYPGKSKEAERRTTSKTTSDVDSGSDDSFFE